MLRPVKPSSAGSSVSEAVMTSSTASDTVKAKPFRDGQADQQDAEHRDDDDEAGEHHGPAGGRDRARRSPVVGSWPSARLLRYRVTMSSA